MPHSSVLANIRAIFLHPMAHVTTRHAAALLGWSMTQLRIAITQGDLETETTCSGIRVPLAEVATIARDRWQPVLIERALGENAKDILPDVLRTRSVSLRLSKYLVATLHHLAVKEGVPVDVIAARQLDLLAVEHADELAAVVAGFAEATEWPTKQDVQMIA